MIASLGWTGASRGQPAVVDEPLPRGTSPEELGLVALTDDPTQDQLFANVIAAAIADDPSLALRGPQLFSLLGKFRFPNDTTFDRALGQPRKGALFGVDISHWTPNTFPIERLGDRNVKFLYMKATQERGVDPAFARFWLRAGKLTGTQRVHRGAYHFLTCGDPKTPGVEWGKRQAEAFVKVIRANGGLLPTDMPPVVDLEWDVTSTDRDRWSCRTADDILATVTSFLDEVTVELHRTPAIYTARSWWRERIGPESKFAALAGHAIWIADYSAASQGSEKPPGINNQAWAAWQFTDRAVMADGVGGSFDANVFKIDPAEFDQDASKLEKAFLAMFAVAKFEGETFP
jgi:lysozyme